MDRRRWSYQVLESRSVPHPGLVQSISRIIMSRWKPTQSLFLQVEIKSVPFSDVNRGSWRQHHSWQSARNPSGKLKVSQGGFFGVDWTLRRRETSGTSFPLVPRRARAMYRSRGFWLVSSETCPGPTPCNINLPSCAGRPTKGSKMSPASYLASKPCCKNSRTIEVALPEQNSKLE